MRKYSVACGFHSVKNSTHKLQYYDRILRSIRCGTFSALIGSIFEIIGVFGDGMINSLACFCIMFIPEIGVYAGCLCVLFIGVDRIISINVKAVAAFISITSACYDFRSWRMAVGISKL
ncbi:hypothetical protein PRIPAC_79241 [Pristionchus pacificus]|uniref:G protein-coupled receptor n=1 Tax=Pristionchus pacificus TaxID=54126 RepID=A0A2A6CNX9_PRIPA|nr:hypothetical protein PRIPAC_79241 [Pristionchus pacificus]|eukprot:PDM79839.1 G protein-coupled receptor [Pristionchus pacificus]